MEWVLQFLDELDDVIGVLRHGWLGIPARVPAGISIALGTAAGAGASPQGASQPRTARIKNRESLMMP
jgi:hypothetical protein